MNATSVAIRIAPVESVRPLRRTVLRPDQPPEACVYPGDDAPASTHFAAFHRDDIVGIASLYYEPSPRSEVADAWRLRGMATSDAVRGTGVGGRLLQACIDHVRAHSGRLLWCNARTPAEGFYQRYGFETLGDVFDLPDIGPHVYMHLRLDQ